MSVLTVRRHSSKPCVVSDNAGGSKTPLRRLTLSIGGLQQSIGPHAGARAAPGEAHKERKSQGATCSRELEMGIVESLLVAESACPTTSTPLPRSVPLPPRSPTYWKDTGSQKDHMKSESDKCLDQAKKRIEILNEVAFLSLSTLLVLHKYLNPSTIEPATFVHLVYSRMGGKAQSTGEEGGRREEAAGDGAAGQGEQRSTRSESC